MKKPAQAFCVGLVFFGALTHPVVAQTSETDSSTPLPSSTGQAGDLKVLPRIGASFTTTGAGYEEPFFSLEGFVPLQQTPGSNLTFLEGRALVLTDSTFGTNLILGQRFYRPSQNIVLGGYLSYDVRDTGNTTFHQIGAGFEKLGDVWDFRINGYLPVGNTREQIAESISNPFFQQNFLLLERSRQFQAAMAGFDMEAGGRLLRIGNGDLRGYAGMYYYSATGSEDALGVKGRLEARPNDNFRLGLSVQHDPLFDTSVVLSLGMNFPGSRPRGVQRGSALARMGESVGRTATITVDEQRKDETIVATNPKTGSPWIFRHVNLGAETGNGTFENPAGTVQDALNVAQADNIVYVQPGTNPGIPAFTIPTGVSVFSTGPIQAINTVELGTVQLPLSGSGVFPKVTGTVAMGNNTTLSGFAIASEAGAGLEARGIGNAVIRDNTIASSTQSAIFLENTTGTLSFTNNTITGNGVPSLLGTNISNLAIANSRLISENSATDGISLNGVSGTAEIRDNAIAINNATGNGISLTNATGTVNITANSGSQITKAGRAGVSLTNSTGAIALSGFEIANSGTSGIVGTSINNVTIRENRITNSTEQGIILTNAAGTNAIANNTIVNSGASGLFVQGSGNVQEDLTVNSNTISNSGRQGIFVQAAEGAKQKFTSNNNTVSASNGQGIFAQASGTSQQEIAISNSTVNSTNLGADGTGGQGIFVQVAENAQQTVNIDDSNVTDSAGQGIFVQASGNTQQQFNSNRNQVSNSAGQGLFVQSSGTARQQFALNDSKVDSTTTSSDGAGGQGIFVQTAEDAQQQFTANGNQVSNSAGQGVFIQASGGTQKFTASSNQVSKSTGQGIFVQASGTTQQEFSVTDSQVNQTNASSDGTGGQGIFVQSAGDAQQKFTADRNSVNNSAGQGIFVQASGGTQQFTADSNKVSTSTGQGIFVQASGNTQQQFAISNSQVNRTNTDSGGAGGQGIFIQAAGDVQQKFSLDDSQVKDSAGQGIFVQASGNTQQEFTANGNQVTNSTGQGIFVQASGNTQQQFSIDNSTISSSGGQGIFIQTAEDAQETFTLRSNTITESALDGIFIQSSNNARTIADIQFNILRKNNIPGVTASMNSTQTFCLGLNQNRSDTDFLLQRNAGTFQVIGLNGVNARNTGTVNFAPGIGSFTNVTSCP